MSRAAGVGDRVQYQVLGPVQVIGADGPVELGPPKRRALLALLLMHAGRSVSVEKVLDSLWPDDPPAGGVKTLHVHVSKLRSSLRAGLGADEPQPIATDPTGYRIELAPNHLDAERLAAAVSEAGSVVEGNPARAVSLLVAALGGVRGTPYEDVALEDFAQGEVRRLEELVLAAEELRIDATLRLGRASEVVPDLERIVADHPHRERSWAMLMLALHRTGRQADALRAYSRAAKVLGEELGIEPGRELQRLEEQILMQDPALAPAPGPAGARPPIPPELGNLPSPLTGFVGRSTELEAVLRLLSGSRLVTLTGSGGTGKTRLAIEAARRLTHPDGRWLVRLGRLHEPSGIAALVCDALGFSSQDEASALSTVVHELRHRSLVLVLDNCEHVIEGAAAFVEAVTSSAPGVTVLATSREPLQLSGEVVARLLPMRMPHPGTGLTGLEESDAGRLLLDRATEAGYTIDEAEAEAAIRLSRAVEGVALALELAAAKLRSMSLTEVVERLDDRFALLVEHQRTAEDHQRTLERAVEWSFELLAPEEQEIFCRLTVFRGGWSLEAAEAVVSGDGIDERDVARILTRLVDKSLVGAERSAGGQTRYGMLETLRQFGEPRLLRPDRVRSRHLAYLATLAERGSLADPEWVARLDEEAANIRAAMGWAIDQGDRAEDVLRVVAALGGYFASRDRVLQPVRWIDAVADHLERTAPDLAARALVAAGDLALIAGDTAEAARWHAAAAAYEGRGIDQATQLRATRGLGRVALESGDRTTAAERFEDGRRLAEAGGDQHLLADVLVDLASVADRSRQEQLLRDAMRLHASAASIGGEARVELQLGWFFFGELDLAAADACFERAVDMADAMSDRAIGAAAMMSLGDVMRARGLVDRAQAAYEEAYRVALEFDTSHLMAFAAGRLGDVAGRAGEPATSRRRLAESLSHWRRLPPQPGRASALLLVATLDLSAGRSDVAARHADDGRSLWAKLRRGDGLAWASAVDAAIAASRGDERATVAAATVAIDRYSEHLSSSAVLDPWLSPEAADPGPVLDACRLLGAATGSPALAAIDEAEQMVQAAAPEAGARIRSLLGAYSMR